MKKYSSISIQSFKILCKKKHWLLKNDHLSYLSMSLPKMMKILDLWLSTDPALLLVICSMANMDWQNLICQCLLFHNLRKEYLMVGFFQQNKFLLMKTKVCFLEVELFLVQQYFLSWPIFYHLQQFFSSQLFAPSALALILVLFLEL